MGETKATGNVKESKGKRARLFVLVALLVVAVAAALVYWLVLS